MVEQQYDWVADEYAPRKGKKGSTVKVRRMRDRGADRGGDSAVQFPEENYEMALYPPDRPKLLR